MVNDILKLKAEGLTYKQISSKLKISTKTIWKLLKDNKLVKTRQKELTHDYFSKIDNAKKAYLLGLLMADGCISSKRNSITLSLKKEDRYMLEFLKDQLNSQNAITEMGNSFRISINSKQIVNDLKKLGCVDRKTYKNSDFPKIPHNLINDFIRGYFDGDGHISAKEYSQKYSRICYNFNILAQEKYKNFIVDYFSINYKVSLSVYPKKDCKNNLYILKTGKLTDIIKIFDLLYNGGNVYLERKKLIWNNIINKTSRR